MNRQPGAGARKDFAPEHVLLCDLESSLGEEKLMWTEGEEASSLQSSSTVPSSPPPSPPPPPPPPPPRSPAQSSQPVVREPAARHSWQDHQQEQHQHHDYDHDYHEHDHQHQHQKVLAHHPNTFDLPQVVREKKRE